MQLYEVITDIGRLLIEHSVCQRKISACLCAELIFDIWNMFVSIFSLSFVYARVEARSGTIPVACHFRNFTQHKAVRVDILLAI